jgi:hypothetical protein
MSHREEHDFHLINKFENVQDLELNKKLTLSSLNKIFEVIIVEGISKGLGFWERFQISRNLKLNPKLAFHSLQHIKYLK